MKDRAKKALLAGRREVDPAGFRTKVPVEPLKIVSGPETPEPKAAKPAPKTAKKAAPKKKK